ncbi:Chromosomal replication initiator protein DnaA [uncultured Flavonifractor sp.]|uniref:Chromosomal replication initiator protein DnaA n=2 Tax=Eubacteriales TaxID=186802 RepID=A0A8J6JAJ7_9FIRM|nr:MULTISPECIES: chromosomal replication initiator protein DnaA [Eubacteriales]SCH38504.1 Chromosomal replication initiator protein DnaA [uncultured Clostridium sp.]SCI67661.1 Chromosomal replication initiator protein DnaA [uncultured Flavonifractor sp.]MBC5723417.1 chromosomal replication initiator protein DnaA [Flintibacter hominis]MCU6702368.1 chromosomal replication initiator protein DnaA [Muriventricola aceti]SCJ01535.1 Chromosomal replication initiator protein DnaA [uncultured Flavonifra
MNPADDIWAKVIELMKQQGLSPTTIKTWFDDAKAVSLTEDSFTISTPNDYTQSVIKSLYIPKIEAALKELFSMDLKVVVLTEKELENTSAAKQDILFPGTSDYTFERFVVGSSNRYAYSAARAVADIPGRAGYNPLFIYGESGLGKTHLLYAIAHTIHANHPDYKIVYIKGDTFTNELVAAIREGRNQQFREKYREADVFLMDDVQFIAGRESTQEEMFHTFNTLYEAGHQIVFTSDRPPKELLRLDQRLQTRFEQGLPADIKPPDYETRMAIIKTKAVRMGLDLPEFLLQLIAENITANVRQIEGTINKIMAYRDLMGATVDKDTVVRAVKDMFKEKSDILPTADVIIDEVCKFYNIEPTILRGQGRSKDIVLARQIAMYQIRRMTNLSLDEIGQEFSGRDHSTVIHSIRQIEESIKSDSEKAEIVKDITANINSRYE